MQPFLADPFDSDRLHEECGVFGVIGMAEAANFVALGLHALQHRGQEAGGIIAHHPDKGFNGAHRFGYVRDNFTKASLMETLPGEIAIGHVRYSTAGAKGPAIRDVQPFFGEFAMGGCAIAHNGNITNAVALRRELIERGSIFQSGSDSECIIHLMARSIQTNIPERMKDALRRVEGAFSVIAMTRTKLIGVRDPLGVRPLVLGQLAGGAYALASETCALDIIGADFVREIEPGEMVVISKGLIESSRPFGLSAPRFCIFEHVYFSRPDSIIGGRSVYETRRQIGVELAREAPIDADLVCPVPDSGTPAAIGYAHDQASLIAEGYPVEIIFPEDGTGYMIESISLIAGGKDLENAKKLYDWALTPRAAALYAETNVVPFFDVPLMPGAIPISEINTIEQDDEWAAQEKERLIEKWHNEVYR